MLDFTFDVFLSHSSKDKDIVRAVADRLRADEVRVWFDEWEIKPGDSIPAKIEEGLEHSRVLVFCMSANSFGSDWAQLESGTFRFRDPLNKERRFIPLRLDGAPIKGSLAQFLYVDWRGEDREQRYSKLLEACQPAKTVLLDARGHLAKKVIQLELKGVVYAYAFNSDGTRTLTVDSDNTIKLWDMETGRCLHLVKGPQEPAKAIIWSDDQQRALVYSTDRNVRLLNVNTGQVIADYRKSSLSNRQMDCFRLTGSGLSTAQIEDWLNLHHITVSTHLKELRMKLKLSTPAELRRFASKFYRGAGRSIASSWQAHPRCVPAFAWIVEHKRALSGQHDDDHTYRLCIQDGIPWRGTSGDFYPNLWSMAWSVDHRYIVSGYDDGAVRMWDVKEGRCELVLEGHTAGVSSVCWNRDAGLALSGSHDRTVRLWDTQLNRCLTVLNEHESPVKNVAWSDDGRHAFSGDASGSIRVWDLSEFFAEPPDLESHAKTLPSVPQQIQYSNAKVLLVGDTHSGKTGLTHRLSTGEWKPSEDSTVGAWSTQWKLNDASAEPGVEREIWMWDFGGQADQRLIHQLYMDHSALILLLFNADQEDVLSGLRDWQTALRRCVPAGTPQFLVAGRIDAGFKASRGKLLSFATEQGLAYHETSAKTGEGCSQLHAAIIAGIPWTQMEKHTSPHIFKALKDEMLKLRDEGMVLHTFKELRELLRRRLPDELRFTDATLQTVIGLLDGPGAVKELNYGTYVLLAPEWINTYAQAVIRTLRSAENDLGVLPLRSIADGKLIYQSVGRDGAIVEMKRLPPAEERVVLAEMERQLQDRGLCLRQGDKLVFPSHCGRDRPAKVEHPSVFVSYAVTGYLDDIYATLVVKLADSQAFHLKELWRDAADFDTLEGAHRMGIKLNRETESGGDISVYFGPGVTSQERVIFANYIHAHLKGGGDDAQRVRRWVCPHCHTPKGNPQVLMKKLMEQKTAARVVCDNCDKSFALWDELEKLFASSAVRAQVEGLQADAVVRLDSRRKGKLLVLDVGARITSANQKWHEIPQEEDEGIDMEVEFTDDEGKGTGRRLYLQLKAGNSHLEMRKKSGVEIFKIRKQRWVDYWLKQPHPVMLVIGTFSEDDDQAVEKNKLEFADVRWMEISSVLKRESHNGKKPVKQIEFRGERLDLASVYGWRDRVLAMRSE